MLRKTIFWNYLGTATSIGLQLLVMPWYLSVLGSTLFGLIQLMLLIQTFSSILDSGISQVLVREVVTQFDKPIVGAKETAQLLFSFERIYLFFSSALLLFAFLIPFSISRDLIDLVTTSAYTKKTALIYAIALFSVQFPGTLYRATLIGLNHQTSLSKSIFFFSILRHVGGGIIVYFFPSISSYFVWHFFTGLVETISRNRLAWKYLSFNLSTIRFSFSNIKSVFRSVSLISVAVWLGAISTQLDRTILSQMVSIEEFGFYSLASSIALGLLQIIYPLIQAYTPILIKIKNNGPQFYRTSIHVFLIAFSLMLFAFLGFLFVGKQTLVFWLQNESVGTNVYQVLIVLLIGTLFNSLYSVGYLNWLIFDKVRMMVLTNALSIGFCILTTPLLIKYQGVLGAAFGWVFMNFVGFVFSIGWIFNLKKAR